MADFTQIIQEINDDINTNGVGAITGAKLNEVLRDMIAAVNAEKQDKLTIYTEDVENERAEINTSLFAVNAEVMGVLCAFFSFYFSDETGLEVTTTSNSCSFKFNSEEFVVKYEDKWLLSFSKTGFRVQLHDGEDPYAMTFDINNGLAFGDVNIGMRLYSLQQNKQDVISDLATIRSGASAGATAYQKPSGGIPKTDLASGVQTSLGKADTAFQKPSGGIPASDLSTAVQTSLGKADTAVQDVSGKVDKVQAATAGNIAQFVSGGNLKDSGINSDDVFELLELSISVVDASTPPAIIEPNKVYKYGTLSGDTTFPALEAPAYPDAANIYCWTFTTPATAPTITWPSAITSWAGGSAPTINASKSYEVSVMDGLATIIEN